MTLMKQTGAVIGGEGNGGVIYPASHYGRDALVGIALFLSHLAKEKKTVSQLKATYPAYSIAKQKIQPVSYTHLFGLRCLVIECCRLLQPAYFERPSSGWLLFFLHEAKI